MVDQLLHHFSEDDTITSFTPHVPKTNPCQPAAVWAIDTDHAPLYWFPRDCPRVTAWPRNKKELPGFEAALTTKAPRLHAIEIGWLERMRTTKLYRYDFLADDFEPWEEASGQWIADHAVTPVSVNPVGDLVGLHEAAGIELRLLPILWPLADLVQDDCWDFSIVRMMNALPRTEA